MESCLSEDNCQRQANIPESQNSNTGLFFFEVLDEGFFDRHVFLGLIRHCEERSSLAPCGLSRTRAGVRRSNLPHLKRLLRRAKALLAMTWRSFASARLLFFRLVPLSCRPTQLGTRLFQ